MTRFASLLAGSMIALSALPARAQQTTQTPPIPAPGPGYGYYHHMWGWNGGFFFHPLLSFLLIVLIVAIIARAFGWRRYHGFYRHGGGGALGILEERFARGEIDKAEFEEKRKMLQR